MKTSGTACLVLGLLGGLTILALMASSRVEAHHAPMQGFGTSTPGGAGGEEVVVTSLADAGPGTLRDALGAGHRRVTFAVGGEIFLERVVPVLGPFVTIDGFTAPAPGITLVGFGLLIRGNEGGVRGRVHDVIVQGIRIRDAADDGIKIRGGAFNVVVDHVTVERSRDKNVDIIGSLHDPSLQTRDVTVSWTTLGSPGIGQSLRIAFNAIRVSVHHNLFLDSPRGQSVSLDYFRVGPAGLTADIRSNVILGWGPETRTLIHHGASANVVDNFYSYPGLPRAEQQPLIVVEAETLAVAFVEENMRADFLPLEVTGPGIVGAPFGAPAIDTRPTCLDANRVLLLAGALTLDPDGVPLLPDPGQLDSTLLAFYLSEEAYLGADIFRLARPVSLPGLVTVLHETLLGRAPDPEGLAVGIEALRQQRLAAARSFIGAAEFQTLLPDRTSEPGVRALLTRLYVEILGRAPDADGLAGWIRYVTTTGDLDGVAVAFLTSAEFEARPLTVRDYVTVLYRAFLGRGPDPAGLDAWEGMLLAQLAEAIATGLFPSDAYQSLVAAACR